MLKHEARKVFLQKRNLLSSKELVDISSIIHENFRTFLTDQINAVHVYLPIKAKKEIDTWPIIKYLWAKGRKVAVPVVAGQENKLYSYELTEETNLVDNKWKVPEPADGKKIDNNSIDLVLVPLLSIDQQGYRVGYGKGYYDTFLKTLEPNVLKVGLSHFPPIDKISNIDPRDVPMDYCITPGEIIRF